MFSCYLWFWVRRIRAFFGGESSPGLGHSTRRIITGPDSSPQWLHAGEFHVAIFLSLSAQSRQLSSHQMLERRQRSVRTFTLLGLITLELWGWRIPFRDCGLSLVSIQFHEKWLQQNHGISVLGGILGIISAKPCMMQESSRSIPASYCWLRQTFSLMESELLLGVNSLLANSSLD